MAIRNTNSDFGCTDTWYSDTKEGLADHMMPSLENWAKQSDPEDLEAEVARLREEFIDQLTYVAPEEAIEKIAAEFAESSAELTEYDFDDAVYHKLIWSHLPSEHKHVFSGSEKRSQWEAFCAYFNEHSP